MLRLRHAIERASRRRWLGLLVVLVLALLLVLVALQTVEEGVVGPALVLALSLFVVATIVPAAPGPVAIRMRALPPGRGPPRPATARALDHGSNPTRR